MSGRIGKGNIENGRREKRMHEGEQGEEKNVKIAGCEEREEKDTKMRWRAKKKGN